MTVEIIRRATFSASHRLSSPKLSTAENKKLFGPCARPSGHGHNYVLYVTLKGPVDPQTGIVFNLTKLKQILETKLLPEIDHRHLNLDLKYFAETVPTTENLAIYIWNRLQKWIPKKLLYEVKLEETENNSVIYRGEKKDAHK